MGERRLALGIEQGDDGGAGGARIEVLRHVAGRVAPDEGEPGSPRSSIGRMRTLCRSLAAGGSSRAPASTSVRSAIARSKRR
jgi:hypothetical protein